MTNEEKKKSFIALDNATCHKTKEVIDTCLTNKFKVNTKIPYESKFKGIEYFFRQFKNRYYKFIFKNQTEQKNKRKEILESKELNANLLP